MHNMASEMAEKAGCRAVDLRVFSTNRPEESDGGFEDMDSGKQKP
jgi:hypothetical protein